MSNYHRYFVAGGTFFFTVVTHLRRPILTSPVARASLREAMLTVRARHPFHLIAIVLLPDHLHAIWSLPTGDPDFSTRWRRIKEEFTIRYLHAGGREGPQSPSRYQRQERGIWQRRFWEHTIRDEVDLERHCDYIHFNPVKHHLVERVRDWPYSSFHRWVRQGIYPVDWGSGPEALTFPDLNETAME